MIRRAGLSTPRIREKWPIDAAAVLAAPITLIREQRSQNPPVSLVDILVVVGRFISDSFCQQTDRLTLAAPKVEAREPEFTHPFLLLDQCNVREFYYRLVIEGYYFFIPFVV